MFYCFVVRYGNECSYILHNIIDQLFYFLGEAKGTQLLALVIRDVNQLVKSNEMKPDTANVVVYRAEARLWNDYYGTTVSSCMVVLGRCAVRRLCAGTTTYYADHADPVREA